MASFISIVDFLPQDTELMIGVRPPEDLKPELKNLLKADVEKFPYKRGLYVVPAHLEQPLKIKFSISQKWNIEKDLLPCTCSTPVIPDRKFESLNSIYADVSKIFEPRRRSHGGTVYDGIYFKDQDGYWKPLEERRAQIYEPLSSDYEEKVRIYSERTPNYIRANPAQDYFFQDILRQERLISTLKSENQDLLIKVQNLNKIFQRSKINIYKQMLEEFRTRLTQNLPETSGNDSWQAWIYKNNWLFATQYGEPFPKERIGFDNIPDFLFPTLDGFIDILEIKKPTFTVIEEDTSHRGAYKWSKEATEAIGQVVNYLYEIETHELEIARRLEDKYSLKLSAIKPRAVIVIGKSNGWNRDQRAALRKLNHCLYKIEIVTYTDLLRRGESLVALYEDTNLAL